MSELIMMGVLVLTTCLTQAVGILVLVNRLDLIQTMLLKMQANELERLIDEQNSKKAMKDALVKPYE